MTGKPVIITAADFQDAWDVFIMLETLSAPGFNLELVIGNNTYFVIKTYGGEEAQVCGAEVPR